MDDAKQAAGQGNVNNRQREALRRRLVNVFLRCPNQEIADEFRRRLRNEVLQEPNDEKAARLAESLLTTLLREYNSSEQATNPAEAGGGSKLRWVVMFLLVAVLVGVAAWRFLPGETARMVNDAIKNGSQVAATTATDCLTATQSLPPAVCDASAEQCAQWQANNFAAACVNTLAQHDAAKAFALCNLSVREFTERYCTGKEKTGVCRDPDDTVAVLRLRGCPRPT